MAEWCFAYKRPEAEFWELTPDTYERMIAYAREYMKAMGAFGG